jgi:hypothetical protein
VRERQTRWLLAAGAVGGMALAVMSLLSSRGNGPLPTGLVARVNGVDIRAPEFERAVAALAADRRMPLTEADRRYVLDRLIDEELLVQYGLSLGLARSDRRIRGDFVASVIASQVASVDGSEPSDGEAREFFRENRAFFSSPARLWARSLWVRGPPARSPEAALARAREAVARLRSGESFHSVESELGDPLVAAIPDSLLPPAKLREYVGPSAVAAVAPLAVGEVSDPVVTAGGVRVMLLVARETEAEPEFGEVEAEVRNEMKRRAGDTAIRRLLEELRAGGEVEVAGVLP